jgi:hypothetical protein
MLQATTCFAFDHMRDDGEHGARTPRRFMRPLISITPDGQTAQAHMLI